jgi:hypothetical protein
MRIKLSEKYQNEREDICNKIINILNLTEDNTKYNNYLFRNDSWNNIDGLQFLG